MTIPPSQTAPPTPSTPHTAQRTPAPSSLPSTLQSIPPNLFDISPSIERLLARLLLPSPGLQDPSATVTDSDKPDHKRQLDIQQLDKEANAVRVQIQKLRTAVLALPDMGRGVEAQREEMKLLEERIERQKEVLRGGGVSLDAVETFMKKST